jgi:hypothetical protein
LQNETGLSLDDSIDHELQYDSLDTTGKPASSSENKEASLLERLVQVKSRAMISQQDKEDTDKAVQQ